ncbi:MAG TPA: T9SS type A sorting domain-containing protein [Bacteroidia bacterium]|nr:T9SS type A sorting domain-containing protein [Bacteroidia bacterium]
MKYFTTPFLVFVCVFSLSFTGYSQNYSTVNFGNPASFQSELRSSQIIFSKANDYYSWSRFKTTKIESVITFPSEIHYYTFNSSRDTATIDTNCGSWDGPSWMGDVIIETNNGMTYLFNESGDTIRVDQNAITGQSWIFYQFSNGASINATVNSITQMTIASITDSVKEIQLQVLDSLGQPNLSHPANNLILLLSKNNGWFRTVSMREFPFMVLPLNRIELLQVPQVKDIYDFSVGDEFEYIGQCYNFSVSTPPGYTYIRIDGKWLNAAQDTVFYQRLNTSLQLQFNPFPSPHLDSLISIVEDTVAYPYSTDPFYPTVPEENNTPLHSSYSVPLNCYTVDQDSSQYNNRFVYREGEGYFDTYTLPVTCVRFNHFEPLFNEWYYSPGLGTTETGFDARSISGNYCQQNLIWFHKGSETWGTFIQLTSGLEELQKQQSCIVYPNPASQFIEVQFQNQSPEQVNIYSLQGKIVKSIQVLSSHVIINLSDLAQGSYILKTEFKNTSGETKLLQVIR